MKCTVCGAMTQRIGWASHEDPLQEVGIRICSNGHETFTREVPTTFVMRGRELASAQRRVLKRVALFERDERIARDWRPSKEVADDYGITPARVRQIRIQAQLRKKALP